VLGEHDGIHHFTIGQRRGLKVAMGVPYYVTRIDALSNTITLGPNSEIKSRVFEVSQVNWLKDTPADDFKATVKIRYNSMPAAGLVTPAGQSLRIELDHEVSSITAGQAAVVYVDDGPFRRVVCGGWIDRVIG